MSPIAFVTLTVPCTDKEYALVQIVTSSTDACRPLAILVDFETSEFIYAQLEYLRWKRWP